VGGAPPGAGGGGGRVGRLQDVVQKDGAGVVEKCRPDAVVIAVEVHKLLVARVRVVHALCVVALHERVAPVFADATASGMVW